MTKKEAIKECKELWEEIEESGLSKDDFLATSAGRKWVKKEYRDNCPLCHYTLESDCTKCPLITQYGFSDGDCDELGFDLNPPDPRFLEAIRGLK